MSLSSQPPQTQHHDDVAAGVDTSDEDRKMKDLIREGGSLIRQGGRWGFPIVRCTYTSASRWEKYLSLIHEDVYKFLEHPLDRDLRESFHCPIIEDEARLEGATWQEARTKYDAWAWDRIREQHEALLGEDDVIPESFLQDARDLFTDWDSNKVKQAREQGNDAIPRMDIDQLALLMPLVAPRWTFFIFADQASVDSVVDHAGAEERQRLGCYYFTLVLTGLHIREHGISDDLFLVDDESDDNCVRETRQKFKAYELVELVASIIDEGWTYGYTETEDGICEL